MRRAVMSLLYSEGVVSHVKTCFSHHEGCYSLLVAFITLIFFLIYIQDFNYFFFFFWGMSLLLEYLLLDVSGALSYGSNHSLGFMKKYSNTKAGMSSTWPWTSILAHFDRQLSDHFLILHIVMFVSPDIQSSHNGSLWGVCCRLKALLIRRCWKLLIAIALSEILHISVLTNKHWETPLRMSHGVHKYTPLGSDVLCIVLLKNYKEMLHILVDQNIPDGCSASTAKYWTDAKPCHKTRACEPRLSLGVVIL